jgi:hypothetical protein
MALLRVVVFGVGAVALVGCAGLVGADFQGLHATDGTAEPGTPPSDDAGPDATSDTDAAPDTNIDSGPMITCHADADNDGYGAIAGSQFSGTKCPPGFTTNGTDCDDEDPDAFPGQTKDFDTPRANGSFDFDCDGKSEVGDIDMPTAPKSALLVSSCSDPDIANENDCIDAIVVNMTCGTNAKTTQGCLYDAAKCHGGYTYSPGFVYTVYCR